MPKKIAHVELAGDTALAVSLGKKEQHGRPRASGAHRHVLNVHLPLKKTKALPGPRAWQRSALDVRAGSESHLGGLIRVSEPDD